MMSNSGGCLENNWVMNRGGFLNYWCYDHEIFDFKGGNLLLRGENGTGKSVTMQACIPLLLDGNKSPQRLDPFATRSRKMSYYIIGGPDSGKEDEISYVFLELKRRYSEDYKTVGIGFRARRKNPKIDAWHFIIRDGRRIDKDFFLYEETSDGKKPLSKKTFKHRLGNSNKYTESPREYMEEMNKEFFGFEDIKEYEQLINLIIQLRSPKLNTDFRPEVIGEILNDSLESLSDDDLNNVTNSLKYMDDIEESIETLKMAINSAIVLKAEYDRYNKFLLNEKVNALLNISSTLNSKKRELKNKIKILEEKQQALEELETKINELDQEYKKAQDIKKEYEGTEAWETSQNIEKAKGELKNINENLEDKNNSLVEKRDKRVDIEYNIKELSGEMQSCESEIEDNLEEMKDLAEHTDFRADSFQLEPLRKKVHPGFNFEIIESQMIKHSRNLRNGKDEINKTKMFKDQYDEEASELDSLKDELEKNENKLRKCNQLLDEESQRFIRDVCDWKEMNAVFKFRDENFSSLLSSINQFCSGEKYSLVNDILNDEKNFVSSTLTKSRNKKEHEQRVIKEEKDEKRQELEQIKKQPDPEPTRSEEVIKNRKALSDRGIPFIPFYKAVEFRDDVAEDEKNYIESSLLDMGILDALIIPKDYLDKALDMDKDMCDKYIVSNPQMMTHELSDKLKVANYEVDRISDIDIDNAIKSVLLGEEDGSTYLDYSGRYGIGVLSGKSSGEYESKFVGFVNRKRYIKKLIESLSNEIEELSQKYYKKQEEINEISGLEKKLREEFNNFPSSENIKEAIDWIEKAKKDIEYNKSNINNKQNRLSDLNIGVKNQVIRQNKITNEIEIPVNVDKYGEAIEHMEEYSKLLSNIRFKYGQLQSDLKRLETYEERLEDIDQSIDYLIYSINDLEKEVELLENRIFKLKEFIDNSDFEKIKEELSRCNRLIDSYSDEKSNMKESVGGVGIEVSNLRDDIDELKIEIKEVKEVENVRLIGFKNEYNLLFLAEQKITSEQSRDEITKIARNLNNKYSFSKGDTRNKIETEVSNLFHKVKSNFIDYNIRIENALKMNVMEEDREEIRKVKNEQERIVIKARVESQYVHFNTFKEEIENHLGEQKLLLTEKNSKLMKDILSQDISRKINAKIYKSKEWVKRIDNLLRTRDISSGLTFGLTWESRKGVGLNQLDTKELEEIFKGDHELLTDRDLEKLSNHFKSKIEQVKYDMKSNRVQKSYGEIMKEVLDYRNWFEFKVYAKKEGEKRKELTKTVYGTFSGGEKALSTYAPLLASIHAIYEKGREDSPRIVALDEAFAGVSEDNIDDMFGMVSKLDLTYIFNSEKLWGTYPSIKSLSICELLKEKNEDVVGIMRYYWNGKEIVEAGELSILGEEPGNEDEYLDVSEEVYIRA
ncbi:MAG: TIGR02680 family protein [Firmicutes bacterium]|nr:TIGR02680 family protein [Bacillota bacterium]